MGFSAADYMNILSFLLSLSIYISHFFCHFFPNCYPIVTYPVNFPCGRKPEPEPGKKFRLSAECWRTLPTWDIELYGKFVKKILETGTGKTIWKRRHPIGIELNLNCSLVLMIIFIRYSKCLQTPKISEHQSTAIETKSKPTRNQPSELW